MISDEKQKICENIFLYITTELDDWMDTQIFTRTSMKELGELYYSHVLNEVENADTDLLNAVKYSLQGTTQGNGLTGAFAPVRFSM